VLVLLPPLPPAADALDDELPPLPVVEPPDADDPPAGDEPPLPPRPPEAELEVLPLHPPEERSPKKN
jgi:hypothetical protein